MKIHDTHVMEHRPCLHLECSKCLLSVRANSIELVKPCAEDA